MVIEVLFALIVDATFFTGKHRLEWMGLLHVFIYKLNKTTIRTRDRVR